MLKNRRISVTAVASVLVVVCLIISVVFGIITRNSYKSGYDLNDAELYVSHEAVSEVLQNLTAEKLLSELNGADSVFVVTVEKNENIYEAIKSTAMVNRVIKGDESLLNSKIVIHQLNFIACSQRSDNPVFNHRSCISNIMHEGRQYLVFADRLYYYDEFQKTLDYYEFGTNDPNRLIYYFPTDGKVDYLDYTPSRYGDIKNLDYLCFSKDNAQKFEELIDDMLNYYVK